MSELIYAEVDENNIVTRMLVLPEEQRGRGEEYLSQDLGLGGRWFRTEMETGYRKQYASTGCEFREIAEGYPDGAFLWPKPWPTWVLNDDLDWVPPEAKPTDDSDEGNEWIWAEDAQEWVQVEWDYEADLPVPKGPAAE